MSESRSDRCHLTGLECITSIPVEEPPERKSLVGRGSKPIRPNVDVCSSGPHLERNLEETLMDALCPRAIRSTGQSSGTNISPALLEVYY